MLVLRMLVLLLLLLLPMPARFLPVHVRVLPPPPRGAETASRRRHRAVAAMESDAFASFVAVDMENAHKFNQWFKQWENVRGGRGEQVSAPLSSHCTALR